MKVVSGWRREEPIELRDQLGMARIPGRVRPLADRPVVPLRMSSQLGPSLVAAVQRLEERGRVRHVDHHRDLGIGGGAPQRDKPRIVHRRCDAPRDRRRGGPASSRPSGREHRVGPSPSRRAASTSPNASSRANASVSMPAKTAIRSGYGSCMRPISADKASPNPPSRSTSPADAGPVERRDDLPRASAAPLPGEDRVEMRMRIDRLESGTSDRARAGGEHRLHGVASHASTRQGGQDRRGELPKPHQHGHPSLLPGQAWSEDDALQEPHRRHGKPRARWRLPARRGGLAASERGPRRPAWQRRAAPAWCSSAPT